MSNYIFFESRPVWEAQGIEMFLENSALLAKRGHQVNLILIQNGVLMAKKSMCNQLVDCMGMSESMSIWVDDFSLACRSVSATDLVEGVHIANVECIVNLIAQAGCNPVWH